MFSVDVAHTVHQERMADLRRQTAHHRLVKAAQADNPGRVSTVRMLAYGIGDLLVKRRLRARQPEVSPSNAAQSC
ncbi:MAG: hypothetical protein M3220_10185 [Chloroflexota bacterium]|nr:hypothetical protein [Chloroflexota bacterium]